MAAIKKVMLSEKYKPIRILSTAFYVMGGLALIGGLGVLSMNVEQKTMICVAGFIGAALFYFTRSGVTAFYRYGIKPKGN